MLSNKFSRFVRSMALHVQTPQRMAALLISIALSGWLLTPKKSIDTQGAVSPKLDELIPAGFRLVPIAVSNAAAVHTLIEDYGLVDLYSGSKVVARSVKILRSSEANEYFSVFVPESYVSEFLKVPMPLHVVVRNSHEGGSRFETPKLETKPRAITTIQSLAGENL